MRLHRRQLLLASGVMAAVPLTGMARAAVQELKAATPSIPIPPPIGRAERLQRLAKARALMQANDIGAIIVESGASLDYFTGVQWGRSERLTGTVIPVSGDPIIVTPFFEKPSVEESLGIPAEVRTWNEHDEPLKLVADFLRERGLAAVADRDGGNQPLLHPRQAEPAAARRPGGQRQPGRSRLPDVQDGRRDRADAGRRRHHDRRLSRRLRRG